MENEKTPTVPYSLTRSYLATIDVLIILLEKSNLTNEVKAHCKLGLIVVGVIYTDLSFNSGTSFLSKKEFDGFFSQFPKIYVNNRELIPIDMIIDNIQLCIKASKIVNASC